MAQISLRVDDEVKRSAEQTFDDIGLSMSAAINIFLKKVARERRIPFELSADPFYSESNMAHLRRGIAALNAGKGVEHELIEGEPSSVLSGRNDDGNRTVSALSDITQSLIGSIPSSTITLEQIKEERLRCGFMESVTGGDGQQEK